MLSPARPLDDARRVDALRRYDLLDTRPDQRLDEVAALAAHICDTPIALISLVDEHRLWFKSKVGLAIGKTARDVSFSGHAILQPGLFVVPDTALDERFADNPLVVGEPHIRFYAGAPLVTADGHAIGTLCVIDRVARELTPSQLDALRVLSRQVMAQLELRHQARELVESEKLLRIVTNNARVGLVCVTRDHRYAYANDTYAEFHGLATSTIVGRRVADVLGPLYEEQIRERLDRGFRGERVAWVFQRATPDGERHFAVRGEPTGTDGAVTMVVVVITDITDRMRTEATLEATASHYRTLFDASPYGIVIADGAGTYLDANTAMSRMLGYSRDELVGQNASHIVADAERPNIEPALSTISATHDYHREWTFRRKDGSVFTADVVATTMPGGNILAMIHDVTRRNDAIEALRIAEERMRFALESADVGIWDIDYVTGVLRWSPIMESQYGLQPGSFAGTFEAFVALVHPDDRETLLEAVAKAVTAGADFSVENRSIWPDGTVHWLAGSGRIMLGEDGRPVRGIGISLDVSERRTLEAQYQQSQKMEAIGRLAGGVAHDFNNLLTAILGYSEHLLAESDPADPRRDELLEIQKAGNRAAELTRQLLAFSRKQIIEPTLLDLNSVVTEVRAMLRRVIREDVKIVLNLRHGAVRVKADRGQLEQVVMNLALNARDAMPAGGTLTIETADVTLDEHYPRTHLDVQPGRYVVLTVSDTGTGMTREVQARLFEPFFTTKEVGKGTGLGLATVHGIVKRSGGSVSAYSELGRGTSFKVYLPGAEGAEEVAEPVPAASRPLTGAETVLVVEDEESLRELIRKLLHRLGYRVLLAENAEAARRVFDANTSIDVLLTDVVMPGASGPELTQTLIAQHPSLRVIYMSGYTEDAVTHQGLIDPGIAFLHKPFTAQTLARKIRDVLDR